MSFFEPPPPPEPEPAEQPQPPWVGPPGNELGAAVPLRYVLVRTDDAAILLDGFVAYSSGVEFELTAKWRVGHRRDPADVHRAHGLAEDVKFGFRFADGRKATNSGMPWRDLDTPGPVLMGRGGHGSASEQQMRYWLWPLPPPGPMQAVVEWPPQGVPQTEVEVDSGAILAAAARVDVLWPEDAAPSGGGWTSSVMTATRRDPPEGDG